MDDPTTTGQAKALFAMSIGVSLLNLMMSLMMLLLNGTLLREIEAEEVLE